MSRTYRKNLRVFEHYKGEYYCCYSKHSNRSMKVGFEYKDNLWEGKNSPTCSPSRFRCIVKVGDGDNYGRGMGGKNKTLFHKIDRSRYRNSLNRSIMRDDYDLLFDVKLAYNPYGWE